jgi:hypothetical protein
MALALVAFELSWVDAGAATCSLANNLALSPIHERGTTEQRDHYMSLCAPAPDKAPWRGAFALTEPLPYVGVDTGVLCGKVRIDSWDEGGEPILAVEKRGRFITGMDFANFATVAVDTDDPRIKSSCMVILEETDPGLFDRGAPTLKMVHQLSSTRDPVFSMKVPASRIIGGYAVKDGCIVPKYSHSEIIAAVFHPTRVPVALMTRQAALRRGASSATSVRVSGRGRLRRGHAEIRTRTQQKRTRCCDWPRCGPPARPGLPRVATARLFENLDPNREGQGSRLGRTGRFGMRGQLMALKGQPQVHRIRQAAVHYEAERDSARFAASMPIRWSSTRP